jgi:hypothetical protein
MIHIYDLNNYAQPKYILKHASDTSGLGGHNIIRYLPLSWDLQSSSNDNQFKSKLQKCIAGSLTGMIRLWSFPQKSERFDWEIKLDSFSSKNSSSPVIDIQFLSEIGHVIAINQLGIISIFDIFNLVVQGFASESTPKYLKRLNIWEFSVHKPIKSSGSVIYPIVSFNSLSITGFDLVNIHSNRVRISTNCGLIFEYCMNTKQIELNDEDKPWLTAILTKKRKVT